MTKDRRYSKSCLKFLKRVISTFYLGKYSFSASLKEVGNIFRNPGVSKDKSSIEISKPEEYLDFSKGY